MDRRSFVAGAITVGGLAASGTPALAHPPLRRAALAPHAGREVRLTGWLAPVDTPSRHLFVLAPEPGARDPGVADAAHWPETLVRVYPADAARLHARGPGRVTLTGRLEVGRFGDAATRDEAGAVLRDARIA